MVIFILILIIWLFGVAGMLYGLNDERPTVFWLSVIATVVPILLLIVYAFSRIS